MSNPLFHNNTVNINDVWFESHAAMLQQICVELGHPDKIDEMKAKFLGAKLKMKAYKDPNKPKRAKSAYFYFCDDKRAGVLKIHRKKAGKNGKINMGNVAKDLAALWKKQADKTKYLESAKKDAERYATEMSNYNENNGN
jgi:hypothetical protein